MQVLLKVVLRGLINNKKLVVQIMAGLVQNRRQAIIWTSAVLVYWRIYSFLGLDEAIPYDRYYLANWN